jgi:Druantia protein DruA
LRRHLTSPGFQKTEEGELAPPGTGKEAIRTVHAAQRDDRLAANRIFLSKEFTKLTKYFASGSEIDPQKISPVLERIESETWQGDLFRLASLTWSVPVSNGFGRRLRYLVWDKQNQKLIGLIAIGDPVFNLSVRDNLIDWTVKDRGERLVNMMDAYVLGALPPYNMLLGGKLVACLLRTRDIYDDFAKAYGDTTGIISNKKRRRGCWQLQRRPRWDAHPFTTG